MTRTYKALSIALAALLLAAGVMVNPVAAQGARSLFDWVIADTVLVQSGGLTVIGPSSLGDTSVSGTASVSGNLTAGSKLIWTPAAVAVMTNGATLTPLGSYQPISSTGSIGFSAITAGTAGQLLTLVNVANTTITITDTGNTVLSGNIALGQYDTLLLISDGTRWIQRGTSNN